MGEANVDAVDHAVEVVLDDEARDRERVCLRRIIAEIGEFRGDVDVSAGEELAALLSDGDNLHRFVLHGDKGAAAAVDVGVQAAAEPPVGRDVQDGDVVNRPRDKQRVLRGIRVITGLGREPGKHHAQLLGIRLGLLGAVLGAAHLRSGNKLQRIRDLRSVLDALDAPLELPDGRHCCLSSPVSRAGMRPTRFEAGIAARRVSCIP